MAASNTNLTSMALEMLGSKTNLKKTGSSRKAVDPRTNIDKARQLLAEAIPSAKGELKDNLKEALSFIDNDLLALTDEEDDIEMEEDEIEEEEM